jgi:hypothetical protein
MYDAFANFQSSFFKSLDLLQHRHFQRQQHTRVANIGTEPSWKQLTAVGVSHQENTMAAARYDL